MAHNNLVDGTSYDTKGGRCLVDGTGYAIKKGRTLVEGTGYDISFGYTWKKYALVTTYAVNTTSNSGSATYSQVATIYASESPSVGADGTFTMSYSADAAVYYSGGGWESYPYYAVSANPTQLTRAVNVALDPNTFRIAIRYQGVYTVGDASYSQGDYIEDVTDADENAYPDNGVQDGYWYVKIS